MTGIQDLPAVTKSGTGTWDWDSGTWDAGRGTRDARRETRDARLGDSGTRGRKTQGSGIRGRDKQTTPEFVKYNFRWSRERCNMLESLSGDSTSKAFVEGKSTR